MDIAVSPTAVRNAEAQEGLFEQLRQAQVASGRSLDEVAELLGTDRAMVEDSINGLRDLTLTELRLLAFALNAVIEYEVESASLGDES